MGTFSTEKEVGGLKCSVETNEVETVEAVETVEN